MAENSRWPPEISAEKRKSQYLKDRLTDRHEIFIVASYHPYKPEKNNSLPVWRKIQDGGRK